MRTLRPSPAATPSRVLLAAVLSGFGMGLGGCAHAPAPAPATGAPARSTSAAVPGGPAFVHDDWPGALARAKAEGKPLFVDAWAPWCHTCVSMQAYVFPDPALAALADRYVWLAIDTENPANRDFVARFPLEAWPTLLVVDPRTGAPVRRWLGSATADELAARLQAAALMLTPGAPDAPAQQLIADASEADSVGDHATAASRLARALEVSAPKSLDHGQAAEALVLRLQADGRLADCTDVARRELDRVAAGTVLANVAATGLACALELPESHPRRSDAIAAFESRVGALAQERTVVLLADDRSSLFETLVSARKARGDLRGSRVAAEAWAAYLDEQAAHASEPAARAVFDSHRLAAALALGEPERVIPVLEQSARDFPTDYNPPARLALAYLALREPAKALAEAERAEARVYGPRTLRVLLTRAEAEAALGDDHAARITLARADRFVARLPPAQRSARMESAIAAKRKALFDAPRAASAAP